MSTPSKPPRARCDRCWRPLSHCLCAYIPSVSHRTRVLVLQHPDEARHPLNTARLAVLGLQHADLWVGEHFPALEAWVAQGQHVRLLFPVRPGEAPLSTANGDARPSSLIVPDGTWRKARQVIRANPLLDTLPRLGLPVGSPSQYRIRKTPDPAALSTIEAIVRALESLEPEQDFQPVLRPFNQMVQQQIQAMGEDVFRRHHRKRISQGKYPWIAGEADI